MTRDLDALFAQAVLTCARGTRPRDGGAAIMALCDWIKDNLGPGEALATADPLSGITMVVFDRPGLRESIRLYFTAEDNDDDLTILAVGYSMSRIDESNEKSDNFAAIFFEATNALWKGSIP